jgi:hypothetical protein
VLARAAVLALLVCSACQDVKELGGGAGLDLTFIPGVGQVFTCDVSDGTQLELCFEGEADDLAQQIAAAGLGDATCGPTQRHLGPCVWTCGGRGCNATGGCWGCP